MELIVGLAIFGFFAWVIMQIPMPGPVKNIVFGLICLVAVLWVLGALGFNTGLPRLRLFR